MSVSGFQRALCDLVASPELCLRLRDGEEGMLDGYELSGRERRRLVDVVAQPGMSVNCTLYRVNRVTPLYSMLPRTCTLLGDRLREEASAFWDAESTDLQFGHESERFAAFLRARVEAGALRSPYLLEVLEFELAVGALRFAPRRRLHSELRERAPGSRWEASPLLRVVRFEHDPGPLLEGLAHGRPPVAEIEPGEFHLVLDAGAEELVIRPLDPRLGKLLERAGKWPVSIAADDERAQLLVDAGMLVPVA